MKKHLYTFGPLSEMNFFSFFVKILELKIAFMVQNGAERFLSTDGGFSRMYTMH